MNEWGALMIQLQIENEHLRKRVRMLEVQAMGGMPAADGKGEILTFKERRRGPLLPSNTMGEETFHSVSSPVSSPRQPLYGPRNLLPFR